MKALAVLALCTPAIAFAAPFDGTWKGDMSTLKITSKPEVLLLKDGTYTCSSCIPAVSVKADGTDQPVTGHPYYDTLSVQATDPNTVNLVGKKAGKPAFENTLTVAADGKTMTTTFKTYPGTEPITGTDVRMRVKAGPKGSAPVSGAWKSDVSKMQVSDSGLTVTYMMTADGFKSTWAGQSYDAKFDGKPVPVMNDPGNTTVVLKRISANKVTETDSRGGKVVEIFTMTVAKDGKTMEVVDKDIVHGTLQTYKAVKQA